MNEQDLAWQLKYSSSKHILVVTWYNQLKRIFCPFKVLVRLDIGALKQGQTVIVQEIKATAELKLVYQIDYQFYYYHHFEVIVED